MRNFVGWGADYPRIAWPNSARVAVSVTICFEEGAERTPLEGDDRSEAADREGSTEGAVSESLRRDLQVESLWEYGARRGIWRLLSILDRHAAAATFFCAGRALERNPQVARAIVDAGHEVAAHGYRHVPYTALERAGERADIARAVSAIEQATGQRPVGWLSRAPSIHTRGMLSEHGGFVYDSDSCADDLPHFNAVDDLRLLSVPNSPDLDDRRFWTAPGVPGFTRPDDFFQTLQASFDRLYREGRDHPRMMSINLHPRNSGRPSRAGVLERFLLYIGGFSDVWLARRVDIARHWLSHNPPLEGQTLARADHHA
jgi:peptidoglycan/xylan/chitin deacetylase (PgdA/CDA1 family)